MSLPLIILGVVAGASFGWWMRGRQSQRATPEDPEVMKMRAHLAPQLHAAYRNRRGELLEVLVDEVLIDAEEGFYTDSLVWRRQYLANPTAENKSKVDLYFNALRKLHYGWELNHPNLKDLVERIGNIREAMFIVAYGSAAEVRALVADARGGGWGKTS